MSEEFVAEALSKGDDCFGILDGQTLAAYSWYSSKPTRIRPRDLWIQVDERYIYMYKGFTRPRYRGHRLHAIGKTMALQAFIARGWRGMISYVDFDHSASLKSARRMGARLFGSVYITGAFGHYLVRTTRGARKFGVRVGRDHLVLGVPSPDSSSTPKVEKRDSSGPRHS